MSIASTRRNSARWGLALLSTTTVTAAMLAPVPAHAAIESPPSAKFEITLKGGKYGDATVAKTVKVKKKR